jgi:hypothetical protein
MKDSNPKDAIADSKIPLWLLSGVAKACWAVAQFAGTTKYGAWNWRIAGVRASVYASAGMRHFDAWLNGEEYDPVDGTHHLGNAMACAAIILDARAAGKLIDDRPPSVDIRPTYAEQEAIIAKLREQYADKHPRHYTIADTEPAEWLPKVGNAVKVSAKSPLFSGREGHIAKIDTSHRFPFLVRCAHGGTIRFSLDELEPA